MDSSADEFPRCAKCNKELGGGRLPPMHSFSVLRCPSCNALLALIFGCCIELNEKTLSNPSIEIKAQYLYQVLTDHFARLSEAIAQEVAETWEEVVEANKTKEKKPNGLKKLQQNIEKMDIDSFNSYLESLDPPDL